MAINLLYALSEKVFLKNRCSNFICNWCMYKYKYKCDNVS